MLAVERRQAILDRLRREGRIVVAETAKDLSVTEETVRRDLNRLGRDGLLSRTHGGALPRSATQEDMPYHFRHAANMAAKRAIGARAAALVPDGAAVMLDSSSTAYEALRALQERRSLTVVTNSVRLLADAGMTAHTVLSTGGELRRTTMTFVGPLACDAVSRFNADVALISCKALSLDGGPMDANLEDAAVKRAMVARASKVVLLADGSKFGGTALVTICKLDEIDALVTDRSPPDPWPERLREHGVALLHG